MFSSNMKFEELSKLNYCGVGMELNTDILLQAIPNKADRDKFIDDYSNAIKQIFADSHGVDKILLDIIYGHKLYCITNVVPVPNTSSVVISYLSLASNILTYVCVGKNKDLSRVSKKFEGQARGITQDMDFSVEYRDILRKIRKQLTDIRSNEQYDSIKIGNDYPSLMTMAGYKIYGGARAKDKRLLPLRASVDEAIECLTQLIFANKNLLLNTLNYSLDLDKYNIDKDKYLFYTFSFMLNAINSRNSSEIDKNIYPILSYYKETVNEDTSKLFYYIYTDENKKDGKKYTYADFIDKLQDYVKKHREINCDILPFNYFDGWDPIEVDEFLKFFTEETLSNFKEIDPEVLFLPNGKGTSNIERGNADSIKKEAVFSLLPLEKREFYSKNRDKIHMSLLGEKKFKGYILNVLNNGYVIFEKYDTKEGDISNKNAAAYIMNIFNFKSLYEMSPSEIRKFAKAQDKSKPLFDRIDYKCHMGKWQERLQKYFDEDTGLTIDDIDEVLAMENVKTVQYKKEKEEV